MRRLFVNENSPALLTRQNRGNPKEKRGKKMKKKQIEFLMFDYIITGLMLKCNRAFVKRV